MTERRLEALRDRMRAAAVEALWIEPSVNFTYLTEIAPISMERLMALVVLDDDLRMVVPELLREECDASAIHSEYFEWTDASGPDDAVRAALKGVSSLRIQGSLPARVWADLRRVRSELDVSLGEDLVAELRARKDDAELDALRRSAAVTDTVVEWVATLDLASMTEARVGGRIAARYLELGHEPTPHPLVAGGPNSALPHHAGSEDRIDAGEPLLVDIGCAVDGYWSDITRVFFPRALDGEVEHLYGVVCDAADAAATAARPGVACKDIDRAARAVVEDAGYGDRFIHRTGHGIGLELHEPPYLTATNEQPLEIGHVFSIEPGVYLPGRFGLRYENIVVVGEGGVESLNHSPRDHRFQN